MNIHFCYVLHIVYYDNIIYIIPLKIFVYSLYSIIFIVLYILVWYYTYTENDPIRGEASDIVAVGEVTTILSLRTLHGKGMLNSGELTKSNGKWP